MTIFYFYQERQEAKPFKPTHFFQELCQIVYALTICERTK